MPRSLGDLWFTERERELVQIPLRSAAITSFTMGNKTLQAAVLLMNSVMIDTRKRRENTAPNGARLPNGFML